MCKSKRPLPPILRALLRNDLCWAGGQGALIIQRNVQNEEICRGLCFCFSGHIERGSSTFRAAILALSSGRAGCVCAFLLGGRAIGVEESGGSIGRVGCQNWLDRS